MQADARGHQKEKYTKFGRWNSNPQLTPTSIGLLVDFKGNNSKVFAVDKTSGAEAFGITLEPAGGSASPTMEQLYTLGKV